MPPVINTPKALSTTRTRTVYPIQPEKSVVDIRTGEPCVSTVTSSVEIVDRWNDTKIGVSNPFYKSQIARSVNATTAFNGFRRKIVREGGTMASEGKQYPYYCSGGSVTTGSIMPLPEHVPCTLPNYDTAFNRALTGFVKKAAGEMTPFSGGVFLGELKRTLAMIRSPAKALRASLSSYFTELERIQRRLGRPSTPRNRKNLRRALASTYLEYRFGWEQLVRDSQDAATALENIRPVSVKKITHTGSDSTSAEGGPQALVEAGLYCLYRCSTSREYIVNIYGGVVIGANKPDVTNLLGLTWPDFVPTAWELIPWSFVVDYFSNVQEIIAAAVQVQGNLAWAGYTWRHKLRTSQQILQIRLLNPDTDTLMSADPGFTELDDQWIERKALANIVPGFIWQLPSMKQSFNLAALYLQSGRLTPFF